MRRSTVRSLLAIAAMAGFGGARQASAQNAYGYSSISITASGVYSTSETDLDSVAQAYYSVETDAYLWVGNSIGASGSAYSNGAYVDLYSPTAINTTYWVQTNHWVIPTAGGSAPNFSCVTPEWYAGSFGVSACGSTSSPTSVYIGTSYASGNTDGYPPSISGIDQTTYGTATAGTSGYVIVYGSNLATPYGTTSAGIGGGIATSITYAGQSQVNIYYSIPANTPAGSYSLYVSTPYGTAYGSLYVYATQPTVQLTDLTQNSAYYLVGDNFQISVTGPPNQPVTMSQNGGSPAPAVNAQGSSSTNSQGVWTNTGTWGLANVGNYTQTYYVAGIPAVPGLSFQVSNGPARYTCGPVSPQSTEVAQGTPIMFQVNVSGLNATVGFQITGPVTGSPANPFSFLLAATPMPPNSSTWSGTMNTGALLGPYTVSPVVTPTGGGTPTMCTQKSFIEVATSTPNPLGQTTCASMNGTWADTLTPAEVTNALWNGLTSGSGNAISGSSLTLSLCNQNFIYSTVSGSYNPANGSYVLNASNPSPGTYVCSGHQFNTINLSSAGNLLSASGGNQAGQCGSGTGVFTGTSQVSERLTTERIPAGESSAGPPAAMWGDAYGYPTSGIFNMTLTSPSGSAYNFGGRWVQEQNPAPGDPTVPTSYTGTDGCYWPNGPWKTQITKLAQPNSPWNVQSSSSGGTYGPDYIGILSPEIVAIVQAGNPTVSAGGSCTIQYPQKMVINQESVIQPNPATLTEPYGSAGSGVNLLQLTVSPTSVTVGRGNVTEIRTFHF